MECALHYCVRSFDLNITNNQIYKNTTTVSTARRSPTSWAPIEKGKTNSTSSDDFAFSATFSSVARTDLALGEDYSWSQTAINGIGAFLNQTLVGRSYYQGKVEIDGYYIQLSDTLTMSSPPAMQTLYNSSDFNSKFDALATSMTNAIRIGGDDCLLQQGSNGILTTTYTIWWPWISLPVTVLLASALQLLVTMANSRDIPLWKSSTLATLSRGRFAAEVLDGAETVEAMQDAAAKCNVDLFVRAPDDKGEWGCGRQTLLCGLT